MHVLSMARTCAPVCTTTSSACVSHASTSRARAVTAFPKTGTTKCTTRLTRAKNTTRVSVVTKASDDDSSDGGAKVSLMNKADALLEKVGLSLGPIGMILGESKMQSSGEENDGENEKDNDSMINKAGKLMDDAGVSLGPIGMTLGGGEGAKSNATGEKTSSDDSSTNKSIANLTTDEWKKKYINQDGTVDLFMKDDFNAASRLAGGAEFANMDVSMTNIENIAWTGLPSDQVTGVRHKVKVTDHETGEILEVDVPENRYVLFEAEQDGWELPNACRMGCCTKCAVKVTKGQLAQPEALGLSKKYRDEGYALLCVSTALSDVECITQDEEEVYQMQFGELFQQLATDKNSGAIVRDDFALEIADMDE